MPKFEQFISEIEYDFSEPKYDFKVETELLNYFYGFSGLTEKGIAKLQKLTEISNIEQKLKQLLTNKPINQTENRQVNHHLLRDNSKTNFYQNEQKKVYEFISKIHSNEIKGCSNKPFDTVVQFGIGGSELGPKVINHALNCYTKAKKQQRFLKAKFIANIDPIEFEVKMNDINPETTLFIFASKSGSTQETHSNITLLKNWWKNHGLSATDLASHCIACTVKNSLLDTNDLCKFQFYLDDHIGGRFSLCSVIGTTILGLAFGNHIIKEFLEGAYIQDQTILETDIKKNISLLAALIGIVERNKLNYPSKAIIPYSFALKNFTNHIQQLDCESNGKNINLTGEQINYKTGPIILGQAGTNAQHSFFQLIHQGTDIIPTEFISIKESFTQNKLESEAHNKLNTNLLAQQIALFLGKKEDNFPGKRPSTLISLKKLSPKSLGALIAFYENKIMFQGFIWEINSFDQPGVQLGKELTEDLINNPDKYQHYLNIF